MCLIKMFFIGIDVAGYAKQNPANFVNEWKKDVKVIKNIKYFTKHDDKLDLFIPKTEQEKYPVHIYIHGGGFVAGNKNCRKAIGYYLAHNSNNIVLNIEYGKSPKFTMIESVQQLKNVLDFIYLNKDKYKFDLDRVSIAGDSSGGFFALYLSLLSSNKELQKEFNYDGKIKIYKTILDCGVYNFETVKLKEGFEDVYTKTIKATTHMTIEEVQNYSKKKFFNPLNFVDENTSEMLLCYSKNDFFCEGQTEELIELLDKYNIKHIDVLAETKDYDHCYPLSWESEKAKEFNEAYRDYVKN